MKRRAGQHLPLEPYIYLPLHQHRAGLCRISTVTGKQPQRAAGLAQNHCCSLPWYNITHRGCLAGVAHTEGVCCQTRVGGPRGGPLSHTTAGCATKGSSTPQQTNQLHHCILSPHLHPNHCCLTKEVGQLERGQVQLGRSGQLGDEVQQAGLTGRRGRACGSRGRGGWHRQGHSCRCRPGARGPRAAGRLRAGRAGAGRAGAAARA